MSDASTIFEKCSPWMRLAVCVNIHVKRALLKVMHNIINDPQLTALPEGTKDLYIFLQNNKSKIQRSRQIKDKQKSILLPSRHGSVDSRSLDVTLIRFLIQTFCNIRNANGNWNEPDQTDQTLCANVYRAAGLRNDVFHDSNIESLDETEFEKKWIELKDILDGLKYGEDIEAFKTDTVEFAKLKNDILKDFLEHLRSYKKECCNEPTQDIYIQRQFIVDEQENNVIIESDFHKIIEQNDIMIIHAEAGMGKTSTARRIKHDWSKDRILKDFDLIFFDSKKMNKQLTIQSNAAALYFSEMGDQLKKNGKTTDDISIYSCVQTTINNLIILIDGVDEFPIKDLVTANYVDELEKKVRNNEKISAADTINAIYFGFLFPYAKICLLGRTHEFEQLKEFISKNTNREIKDLELLRFVDADVKGFTCNKLCKQPNQQSICTGACRDIYEKIKNIELCKIPTDLNSFIKLHKCHPNKSIGKITRTKLIIATLLNRLNEHINQKNYFECETFGKYREQRDKSKFLKCICTLAGISFYAILNGNVTIKVEEEQGTSGIVYFKDENQLKVERKIVEDLDFFYIRDHIYYSVLEPYHTLNIEFFSSCYLFSHPEEWNSILKLKKDRQLVIISLIAGLHADYYFTKDFVKNVLNVSDYSVENVFRWLYDVEDARRSLPNGGYGYMSWYGLMENQKLSPSFYILDYISNEVDIPNTFIPKTIVCDNGSFSGWYDLKYIKHNFLTKRTDKLTINDFLDEFPKFNFMIKGNIGINDRNEFDSLDTCNLNNRVTFKINSLCTFSNLSTSFRSNFKLNSLLIFGECDLLTIDILLDAISPLTTSNSCPAIKSKQLFIKNISRFNVQQTERLFTLGLTKTIDYIALQDKFFTDKQIKLLKKVERNHKRKLLNIKLDYVKFNLVFKLSNLDKRHISLYSVKNVRDEDLMNLRKNITPGNYHNFSYYKIIHPEVPFAQKRNHLREFKESMCLHLCKVDFKRVSSEVFAYTFSLIPSLIYEDNDLYIPSLHWLCLSQIRDRRINELRIWYPQTKNLKHFQNIETNILQFICKSKDDIKDLLKQIVNGNIQPDKEIKVFAVVIDDDDWDHYEEKILLSGKTIKEYEENYESYLSLLEDFHIFSEQCLERWCCEIASPFQKSTDQSVIDSPSTNIVGETEDSLSTILETDDTANEGEKHSCNE